MRDIPHNKTPRVPRYVTRFYGNLEFALDVVANRQITFVHVSTLNDPFDPYFFLETDFDESREMLLKYVAEHHAEDWDWFAEHITDDSWQRTFAYLDEFYKKLKSTSFVLSASAKSTTFHPKDNLYMWGHYGNGHRGVAIEFDTKELKAALLKDLNIADGSETPPDMWVKIEYRKSLSALTAEEFYQHLKPSLQITDQTTHQERSNLAQRLNLLSRVKSSVWKLENEWRLMCSRTTRMKIYRCPISSTSIRTITIGYKASLAAENDFIAEAVENFPQATVFRARKRKGNFALDFELISPVN